MNQESRLAVAAPDLLAAIKELVSQFEVYQRGWLGRVGDEERFWRNRVGLLDDLADARAAIAKAEGDAVSL